MGALLEQGLRRKFVKDIILIFMLENSGRKMSVHEMEENGSDFTVLLLIRITS